MSDLTPLMFERMQKELLWDRLRFAVDVLSGRWTAMSVDSLGTHLEEVLREAEKREADNKSVEG